MDEDGVTENPSNIVNPQPPWGTNPNPPVLERELRVKVYDKDGDLTTWERVTNIIMADNGMMCLQGNVVLGNEEINTVIGAYAAGYWSMWYIDGVIDEAAVEA